jgi:hypothetical protein
LIFTGDLIHLRARRRARFTAVVQRGSDFHCFKAIIVHPIVNSSDQRSAAGQQKLPVGQLMPATPDMDRNIDSGCLRVHKNYEKQIVASVIGFNSARTIRSPRKDNCTEATGRTPITVTPLRQPLRLNIIFL